MLVIDYLIANPFITLISAFILGLMVGSFLNVVIYRLPIMLETEWRIQCEQYLEKAKSLQPNEKRKPFNLCWPVSQCPQCKHTIPAWYNIPLISYLILRGRCAYCRATIAWQYPMVELLTGVLTFIVVWQLGITWQALLACIFTWNLVALAVIDSQRQLLPDNITQPLLWLGLIANYFGLFTPLDQALWGAIIGYLILWSVFWLFKLITKKEGLGYGDFKLLALIGAWGGWHILPFTILVSSILGVIIGLTLILTKRHDKKNPIPFGPYLAIAGWVGLLWGEHINRVYLHFINVI